MILVVMNADLKPRAALFHSGRRFATVCLDQPSNIANASAFGDDPRLSEHPGGQLRNRRRSLCHSLIFPGNTFVSPESPERQIIGSCRRHVQYFRGREYPKRKREKSPSQHGVGGINKGQAVTYTLSDGKKIQKVTDVVTGTGSVVRALSF